MQYATPLPQLSRTQHPTGVKEAPELYALPVFCQLCGKRRQGSRSVPSPQFLFERTRVMRGRGLSRPSTCRDPWLRYGVQLVLKTGGVSRAISSNDNHESPLKSFRML